MRQHTTVQSKRGRLLAVGVTGLLILTGCSSSDPDEATEVLAGPSEAPADSGDEAPEPEPEPESTEPVSDQYDWDREGTISSQSTDNAGFQFASMAQDGRVLLDIDVKRICDGSQRDEEITITRHEWPDGRFEDVATWETDLYLYEGETFNDMKGDTCFAIDTGREPPKLLMTGTATRTLVLRDVPGYLSIAATITGTLTDEAGVEHAVEAASVVEVDFSDPDSIPKERILSEHIDLS